MPKRKGPGRKGQAPLSPEVRKQRSTFEFFKDELLDFHLTSLEVMTERGILPPLYGGEHLGESREAIPLWGFDQESEVPPQLVMIMLRTVNDNEPCFELRIAREDLQMKNDWPVAQLMQSIWGTTVPNVEGADQLSKLSIFLVLSGDQVHPAPGYEREAMLDHMSQMLPYAIFPIVPTSMGENQDLAYHWEDLEHFRAEVVFAETPQLLEAAVWDYRLRLALDELRNDIVQDDGDPAEDMLAISPSELVGMYEAMVMHSMRLYGTTSPLMDQQEKLDILRDETGNLLVPMPLNLGLEPVEELREYRAAMNDGASGYYLQVQAAADFMDTVWPQIRPHRYYALRVRHGIILESDGESLLGGYAEQPTLDWYMAETLPQLHRLVHLASLHEFLTLTGIVKPALQELSGDEEPETSL